MDSRKAKKFSILIYIMVVIFCFLIGTASSSVYQRLPAMQLRYEAETRQPKNEKQVAEQLQREEVQKDILEDFFYKAFYKPIRNINNSWKTHVSDSLQAERKRVIDEKYSHER
ncbi:MAG: hypothetical protein PHT53_00950 [Candidatus Omnitrophica bacterium]|nr:hypothetical protein [Candidatus Omnitrophota bacterium]